ncbi:MAG: WecB/TagA/CpsF family glycosyltransferase [Armatimonadota bacterium]
MLKLQDDAYIVLFCDMDITETRQILGLKIHRVSMESAISIIEGFIADRKPRMVVTADASAVVIARDDHELQSIINEADLVTPDSTGILWGAKHFGTPLIERVSGADMVDHLCRKANEKGYRVFFLGSAPGITDKAAENLKLRYPNLQVVGTHHGYFNGDDSEAIRMIKESKPDMLFVAMGIPMQEKWIKKHMDELGVPVSMGVGGTFDVISGSVKRAPMWMRKHGLEWLHRLISNPSKISKVMTLPIFVMMVLRAKR